MIFATDSIQHMQNYLPKEALKWPGDFKIGQVFRTVKYAEYVVLVGREQTVL